MGTKSYTLADNSTVTVESGENGVELIEGMSALTQAVDKKIGALFESESTSEVIPDKVTLLSGLTTADSVTASFGTYDSINVGANSTVNASNNYILLSNSTINADHATVTGGTTFANRVTLQSGFTTADSITSSFGKYDSIKVGANSTVNAQNSYFWLSGSTVRADYATVTGGVTFAGKVTLQSGLATAASITSSYGDYNRVQLGDDSTLASGVRSKIALNSGSTLTFSGSAHIEGSPTFDSKITLNGGFKAADSITASFGKYSYLNIDNYSKVNVQSNSTVNADHSYLELNNSEMNFSNSTVTGDPAFAGNPTFIGHPIFTDGIKFKSEDGSTRIYNITIQNGKLVIEAGTQTYTFTPDS